MRIAIIGCTGGLGRCVVRQALASSAIQEIHLITRRQLQCGDLDLPSNSFQDSRLRVHVVDFESIELPACDACVCCLGTTIKKAKSADAFKKVDFEYIKNSAAAAKKCGCKCFLLCSSQGADTKSYFLYTRTKGETEEYCMTLDFDKLVIYRPALLLCTRKESRPFEYLLQCIASAADRWNYVSVSTNNFANCMIQEILSPIEQMEKVVVYGNAQIVQMARSHCQTALLE